MLTSMTGFGRAEKGDSSFVISAEVRTVNHRFKDIRVHHPFQSLAFEDKVGKIIDRYIERGRVEVSVKLEGSKQNNRKFELDADLVQAYLDAFAKVEGLLGATIDDDHRFRALFNAPDVLVPAVSELDEEDVWPTVEQVLVEALDQVVQMRTSEGRMAYRQLCAHLDQIRSIVVSLEKRVPAYIEDYRSRLTKRLHSWENELEIDPQVVAHEVVLFADKIDISEELARIIGHVDHFHDIVRSGSSVGRSLDFLLQEIFRELNTIASKARDSLMTSQIVAAKSEVEKMREQVQNIQ